MSSCCGILTHDVLVNGSPQAVLYLQLGVHSVRLELAPLVDVPVGRCEGDGEEADDEEVAQEPEICGDLTREMAPCRSSIVDIRKLGFPEAVTTLHCWFAKPIMICAYLCIFLT